MAIVIRFDPAAMDAAAYDAVIRGLDAAGHAAPAGRIFHACYGPSDRLRVFDVWESIDAFERFGAVLRPLIERAGIDAGAPEILPVHNTLAGDPAPGVVAVDFRPPSITRPGYDESMRRLDAKGPEASAGLVFHTCYGEGDDLRVFDVWSSREALERFAPTVLLPILAEVGIDAGRPEILPVHHSLSAAAQPAAV